MRVFVAAIVAIAATVAVLAVSASGQHKQATSASAPVLAGPWSNSQEGYGHREPPTIFNGGDGSGLVSHIEWLAWGGPRAVGIGKGLYIAPGQASFEGTREAAVVVLFQLGRCHGRRAYDAITWYYPQHGQRFNSGSFINACNGTYHE